MKWIMGLTLGLLGVFLLGALTTVGSMVTRNPYLIAKVTAAGIPLYKVRYTHKFGDTAETTLADAYDIWDCPALDSNIPVAYPYESSAFSLWAMSDSDSDVGIVIVVQGLDANWERVTETVTLGADAGTGTTPVLVGTASNWIRVYRAYTSGSTALTGNLYLDPEATDATGNGIPDDLTDLQACITAGANQTLMMIYTTADDESAYVMKRCVSGVDTSPGTPGSATVGAYVCPPGGVFRLQDVQGLHANGTANICVPSSAPFYIPPRTDVKATILAADGLNRVAASLDLVEFVD